MIGPKTGHIHGLCTTVPLDLPLGYRVTEQHPKGRYIFKTLLQNVSTWVLKFILCVFHHFLHSKFKFLQSHIFEIGT